MSVAIGLYNTSPSYACIYFYYSLVILQASFGASNGPYKPVFTALSMTEIESSVNVDKAEPKHGQVQRKEWCSQEYWCISLCVHSHYSKARTHFLAEVASLPSIDTHRILSCSNDSAAVFRLLVSGQIGLIESSLSVTFCPCLLLLAHPSFTTLSIWSRWEVWMRDLKCELFDRGIWCWYLSLISKARFNHGSTGETSRSDHKVQNSEHDVQDCNCHVWLKQITSVKGGTKKNHVDQHKQFFETSVVLEEQLVEGKAWLNRMDSLVAESVEVRKHAIKFFSTLVLKLLVAKVT